MAWCAATTVHYASPDPSSLLNPAGRGANECRAVDRCSQLPVRKQSAMMKENSGLPLRTWRVAIKTGKFLGKVEAPDQETAEAMAVKAFKLTDEQRERLVVQERRPEARGSQAN